MPNNIITKLSLVACAAALSAGCATTAIDNANQETNTINNAAKQRMEDHRRELDLERKLVRVEDEIYVSPNSFKITSPLPPVFNEIVVLNEAMPLYLSVALERISELTGVHTYVAKDVLEYITSLESDGAAAAAPAPDDMASAELKGIGPKVQLNHRGTVRQLLDRLAANVQSSWEYDANEGKVRFFRYKTEVFDIAVVPADMSMASSVSTSSGTNPNSSAGTTISSSADFLVFESIEADIEAMLSNDGVVSVSDTNSTVVVKDTPAVLADVASYIKRTNIALQREVVSEVTVLSVEIEDQEGYGIDWNAVYTKLGDFDLGLTTNSGLINTAGTVSSTVIDTDSRFNGTNAVISALSTQGKVSRLTSSTIRALNRQMVPLSVGDVISYVSETGTVANEASTTNTVALDEINVGFSLTMLPNVMENGKTILMQLGVNISELNSLDTITSGTTVVQTPNISSRDFLTRGSVRSGQTMVLSGFERIRNDGDWQSMAPNAKAWMLGGGKRGSQKREVLVILVRPVVLDGAVS